MKFTKKVLSVLLATAMIFAVCAMAVSADTIYTGLTTNSNNHPDTDFRYYVDDDLINAQGFIRFYPNTRILYYGVTCNNLDYYELESYLLHAQCAVNYEDETQDFYTISRRVLIPKQRGETLEDTANTTSGKTIISFDAEFQIGYSSNTLWEGRINDEYTLGINA